MATKCPECHSCLRLIWIYGELYRYCTLCRTVYKVIPGGQKICEDADVKRNIILMIGPEI